MRCCAARRAVGRLACDALAPGAPAEAPPGLHEGRFDQQGGAQELVAQEGGAQELVEDVSIDLGLRSCDLHLCLAKKTLKQM